MAFSEAGFGGSIGGQFRLRLQADVIGQDIGGNRSLVRVSAWFTRVSSGSRVWNFYTTGGNVNVDGGNYGRSIGGYDFNPGVGANYFLMNSQDFWIGHYGDGTRVMYVGASYDAGNGPYLTGAGTSFVMGLPTIPRWANITTFYADNLTDEAVRINWAADNDCDYVSWWSPQIDGGAHHDIPVGGSGLFQINANKLRSERQYDFQVAVRRAASGLWTNSGTISVTTKAQNNFMQFVEM